MKKYLIVGSSILLGIAAVIVMSQVYSRPTSVRPTPKTTSPSSTVARVVVSSSTVQRPAYTPPPLNADAYLVGNAETGQVYISHNSQTVSPIASISKLFTALEIYANMDPNQVIEITQPMLDVYPNSYGFALGEKFSLHELMYPLLVQSNNNIAEGIAMTYGYDTFISKLNALATSLGMPVTHFQDASGLSNGNISNAHDLFIFAQYLYASHRDLLALTTTFSWTFASTTDHGAHLILSTDPFIGDPHLVGGKTGRTDIAGETMLTIFNYEFKGKNYPIAIIVLHSDPGQRQTDSERLLFQAMAVIQKQ